MVSDRLSNGIIPYQGLTTPQVEINRKEYGANILDQGEKEPWWKLFLEKFKDPVIQILMVAAAIAIGVGILRDDYVEGIGIIIAIGLATTVGFINEYKANQEFEILNQVYDREKVKVIRDGIFTRVERLDLVVGDIVYLEPGEEIPADGEVIEAVSLFVNESKLTGESIAVPKLPKDKTSPTQIEDSTYPPFNLYRSTIVEGGHGFYRVSAVGTQTEIGKIAKAITSLETGVETPLNIQLEKLSQFIGLVGFGVAALTFIALLLRGLILTEINLNSQQIYILIFFLLGIFVAIIPVWLPIIYEGISLFKEELETPPWLEQGLSTWLKTISVGLGLSAIGIAIGYPLNLIPSSEIPWIPTDIGLAILNYFMVAVTIIVVAVPEGLAISVTLSLAYSMQKMAKSNNLVRSMHACETIGATTVICSDKTGTLTRNEMQVQDVVIPCLLSPEKGDFYRQLIAESFSVNSTADLEIKPSHPPQPLGNVTEGALLLWLNAQKIDYLVYRQKFGDKLQLTFSPERKYMATFGRSYVTNTDIIHVKGAPEVLLDRCSQILTQNGLEEDLTKPEEILAEIKSYQSKGRRVLGFAYHEVAPGFTGEDIEEVDRDLIWLGFVAISDPLRDEVPEAINTCLNAGIKVKVVTGDSPETSKEIARQIGLWQDEEEQSKYAHLTGTEFNELTDLEARIAVKDLKILSRAYPQDKLRLVKLLQANGEVVGVTGDGTNDAAALKQAQVGLSMGSGTALAKESSDIILLDDSFGSIVNAVVWGRSLYENIQRFILFQLTINVVALGIALIGPFIGVSLPLTVTQMLWVNLIMDTFAALALAAEPPHLGVLNRSPRQPQDFIISPEMRNQILTIGLGFLVFLIGFLLYLEGNNEVNPYELSVFFAVFVLLQFWNLFNARCLGLNNTAFSGLLENKGLVTIALIIAMGQILIIQFGGVIFRTIPISLTNWMEIILGTSVVLIIGELVRFSRRFQNNEAEIKS